MPEVKVPLMPYRIEYICDNCAKEKLQYMNMMKTSNPPWYEHMCGNCGVRSDHRNVYPSVHHMELTNGQPES